jgi:hypothetical protein
LYLTSAIGGNLFSGICNPQIIGVGASTAVFGLVGFYLAYFGTNFDYMGYKRYGQRWGIILFVIVLILVNLNVGENANVHVDNFGHLGGFITGVAASVAISEFFDYAARKRGRVPDRFKEEDYEAYCDCCKGTCANWIGTSLFGIWMLFLIIYYAAAVKTDFERDPHELDD